MFISIGKFERRCPFTLTFSLWFASRLSRRYTFVQTCTTERKYHCQIFRDCFRKHHDCLLVLSIILLFSSMLCARHCSLDHRKSDHTGLNMQMINIVYVDSEKRVIDRLCWLVGVVHLTFMDLFLGKWYRGCSFSLARLPPVYTDSSLFCLVRSVRFTLDISSLTHEWQSGMSIRPRTALNRFVLLAWFRVDWEPFSLTKCKHWTVYLSCYSFHYSKKWSIRCSLVVISSFGMKIDEDKACY